jgi:hypothetical protein
MPAPSGRISCEDFDPGDAATVERPGRFWFGFATYEEAYLEGRVPQSLRSVTDDEVRAIAGEVLTREQFLRLGLEEPRDLTPAGIRSPKNPKKLMSGRQFLRDGSHRERGHLEG